MEVVLVSSGVKESSLAAQPFLKWAGGKRALLHEILPRVPDFSGNYIEPFLGAGAVMFALRPKNGVIANDFNQDLIEVYQVVRDYPDELLKELKGLQNSKDDFIRIRAMDRSPGFDTLDPIVRAARFIYLNKTCFNGLYRVNSNGFFNVPYGNYKNPGYDNPEPIHAASRFLRSGVTLSSGDYRIASKMATSDDFIYFDPPYEPVSATSSFVAYQSGGFTQDDQRELVNEASRLTKLGVPVLLSNSDSPFIREIYEAAGDFRISTVRVTRAISATTKGRGQVGEFLIDNFQAIGLD